MSDLILYEPQPADRGDLLFDPAAHAHAMKIAELLASSAFVPEHIKKRPADILLALMMAKRLGEDPLITLQSIYFVQGRPAWAAQYVIARANRHPRVEGGIRFHQHEKPGHRDFAVTASAVLLPDRETQEFTVSWAMAEAEGWVRRNPKYRTMPELMLRYRAATLLARLCVPEVLFGLYEQEELVDTFGAPTAGSTIPMQPAPRELRERPPLGAGGYTYHSATELVGEPPEPADPPPPSVEVMAPGDEGPHQGDEGGGLQPHPGDGNDYDEPAPEPEDRKLPKQNAVKEADMIELRLVTQPRGKPILFEVVKGALKEALGAGRLGDERVMSALRFGVMAKKWELLGEGKDARIILPAPAAKAPTAESVSRDVSRAAMNPAQDPRVPDDGLDDYTTTELEMEIGHTEHLLDERGIPGAVLAQHARDAGLVTNDAGAVLDGAPLPAMVRYLRAIRALLPRTRASGPNGGM